jgi:hypothetical protein
VVAWFGVGPRPSSATPAGEERLALHRSMQCPLKAPQLHPGQTGGS